jgi:hypothetical protein
LPSTIDHYPKTINFAPRSSYETLKAPDGREQSKTCLSFRGTDRRLPFNLTN